MSEAKKVFAPVFLLMGIGIVGYLIFILFTANVKEGSITKEALIKSQIEKGKIPHITEKGIIEAPYQVFSTKTNLVRNCILIQKGIHRTTVHNSMGKPISKIRGVYYYKVDGNDVHIHFGSNNRITKVILN